MSLGASELSSVGPLLCGLLAILARVAGALWVLPFSGGRLVPATVRLGLSLVLALSLLPAIAPELAGLGRLPGVLLLGVLLKEALIGLSISLILFFVFSGVEAAGRLVEAGRGAPSGESSPLPMLYQLVAVLAFLLLGGHQVYLLALGRSFQQLPVTVMPGAPGLRAFAGLCVEMGQELFLLALVLAAPVLASLFVADLTLGWAERSLGAEVGPGLAGLLHPARAVLGLVPVLAGLHLLGEWVPVALDEALRQVGLAAALLGQGGAGP